MELNIQQQAIMQWAEKETGSLNIIARAGCGKSSCLVELTKRITGRVFLGAFNKSIAMELQQRIGNKPNVTASTMHSLGYSLWRKIVPKSEIDSRKVRSIAHKHWPFDKNCLTICTTAVSYGKQAGLGIRGCGDFTEKASWDAIFDHYDLWDDLPSVASPDRMIESCMAVYDDSLQMCEGKDSILDFDDMLLAPIIFSEGPSPMYDWVLGDEWQDANEVRRRIMRMVLKPNGRAVFVSDPAQSIYGFAGATVDSVDKTKEEFNCTELPLSITYRCPKVIVALAQTWVPDIQAHESAPEGTIRNITNKEFWKEQFDPADVILCRNTRPLLGIAKRLRKAGIECRVEGNSGKSLIALATKWGEDIDLSEMFERMGEWQAREEAKWTSKNRPDKVEAIQERCAMLSDVASDFDLTMLTGKLAKEIERMFGGEDDGREILRLCTAHRSKGREWHRVYLVGRNLYMPSQWAKQEWEQVQERNLEYVAVTRVKSELVEVVCPKKKSSDQLEWWEV